MRATMGLGLVVLLVGSGPCFADVSADLLFCSKQVSPRERIACYDAAARIAASGAAQRVARQSGPALVAAPVADTAAPPTYTPLVEKNPFQGLYAAVGGSYGFSSPRSISINSPIFSGFSDTRSAQGFSGRGAIGYNATLSNFLFGAELAGRFGRETISAHAVQSLPQVFALTGPTNFDYQLQNDTGLHIAARGGLLFDGTLLFARAGVGASHVQENGSVDTRGITGCSIFGQFGCIAPFAGALTVAGKSRWVPSAVFGVGAEHNFGPVFARIEGEIETLALQQTIFSGVGTSGATSEPYWFARVMASVGLRF